MFKIGIGEDSHKFGQSENKLILGGVLIDCKERVMANSDGDVILHAICNAFDVVTDLGSIGNYADDMLKKGIKDSARYFEFVKNKADEKQNNILSVSISIEAQKPKLEKYHLRIKKNLSQILKIPTDTIGLTFTTGENLTAFGKGKGIKTTAVILFEQS